MNLSSHGRTKTVAPLELNLWLFSKDEKVKKLQAVATAMSSGW